jgi:hypothetical protein
MISTAITPEVNIINTNRARYYFTRPGPFGNIVNNLDNMTEYIFQDLSNNPQRASANQINAAIERIQYGDIENPLNHSCPISHNDFNDNDMVIILKGCRHIFTEPLIMRWFERHVNCPLCRQDIRDTENTTNTGDNVDPEIQNLSPTFPLPFAQQLANIISNQLVEDRDFSGNISIDLDIPRR